MMGVMKDNIGKVLDRGEKLSDLQDKSGAKTCDIHVVIVVVIIIIVVNVVLLCCC